MSARGEVRYRLTADTKDFESGFKRAEKQMETTGQKMGKLADATGRTATVMARSAQTFGLPADALRKLDDVMDITEIGFNNLSKAAVGFNAATLGVVGAGLALGSAIGTWLRGFEGVRKAADSAAEALVRLFTAQSDLDRQALGKESQASWRARTGLTEERHQADRQNKLNMLKAGGASADMMRAVLLGETTRKDPIAEQIKALEKVARESVKVAKAVDKMGASMLAAARVADPFGDLLGVTASEAEISANYLNSLPGGTDPFFGMDPGGPQSTVALPAPRGPGMFSDAMKSLPGVLLGALQGGGNPLKALGGLFGGAAGGGLGTKVGGLLGSFIPGLGTLLGGAAGGLLGKALGGIGKLFGFGGGPSKEEIAAKKAEEEAKRDRIRRGAIASRAEGIGGILEHGPGFFLGKGIGSAEEAERAGVQFVAAWSAVVKERGPVAAAEAFGGAFDKMKEEILGKGLALPEWMRSVESQMGLGRNAQFAGVANQARAGASFLNALGSAGGLTPEVFRSFEQEARAAFAGGKGVATAEGMQDAEATKAGFAAANPLLKELVNQSVLGDTALSADIQAMVEAQGIVPDVEFQQLDELRAIRGAVTGLNGPTPSGGGGGGSYTGGDGGGGIPQFASGGYTGSRRGLALLHPDEFVIPGSKMRAGGGGGGINVTVHVADTNASPERIANAVATALERKTSRLAQSMERTGFMRRK